MNNTREWILIIVGAILSFTVVLTIVGVILTLIGAYLLNQKTKIENIEQNEKIRVEKELEKETKQLEEKEKQIQELQKELEEVNEDVIMESCGLYKPRYDFINATLYKEKLDSIRAEQKGMIKNKTATVVSNEWTVDGSKKKGQALTNDYIKQILRTFNLECEMIINKVKHSNIESSEKKIRKAYDRLNKSYKRTHVSISNLYLDLKIKELYVAFEYQLKKEEEKEALREAREREREEKKLQKQLEKEKNKFEKENNKLEEEIKKATEELAKANDEEQNKLKAEIEKLKKALADNEEEIEKINEWKEKPGAGYVYIISNEGSFGDGVFKIGVTRRDNPDDRIRELSNASVPFKYDTHAIIFSKDAYGLESELHSRFDDKRVNKVNKRKEFFRIGVDDVKKIVDENKGAVHSFVENPENEEFKDSLLLDE